MSNSKNKPVSNRIRHIRLERQERTEIGAKRKAEYDQFFIQYGSFLALWSNFDLLIEVATMRELRLTAEEASIVCAGSGFGSKAFILRSLLAREPGNAGKIDALTKAQTIAERNTFVHAFLPRPR